MLIKIIRCDEFHLHTKLQNKHNVIYTENCN